MAERLHDDIWTGTAGEEWSRAARTQVTIRGVQCMLCTLVIRESGGAGSRAAGNTTGGI